MKAGKLARNCKTGYSDSKNFENACNWEGINNLYLIQLIIDISYLSSPEDIRESI